MVVSDGTRVSLAPADWLKITISNAVGVGVIIVTLWTKQAVVENEIEHLKQSIATLERKLDSRWVAARHAIPGEINLMPIRNRVVELRRVRASELQANPRNWRLHPEAQRSALRGLLDEVGYAGALLARERDDGRLELIDGHLRAETTPHEIVPVLVLDVSEQEADKLLATIDPLAALATTDDEALAELLSRIETDSGDVQKLLNGLQHDLDAAAPGAKHADRPEPRIPQLFQIVVECRDEDEQREVYETLVAAGRKCRLVML
jgi:hypothetical protein